MHLSRKQKTVLKLSITVVIIIFAMFLSYIVVDNNLAKETIGKYGYLGIFIFSIISGFNLVIPVPLISFFPLLVVTGLNKWLIVLIISLGMTVADSAMYFIGSVGRETIKKYSQTKMAHFKEIYTKHHWTAPVTLFLFATIVPLPNELLIIPLALLGCKLRNILPAVFLGNLAFNTIFALGILSLTKFF